METKHTPGPWLYNDTTAQVHPPHSATIGDRAERLAQYIRKGDRIGITGELGTREHEGKTYITCNVRDVTLLGDKRDNQPAEPRHKPVPNCPQPNQGNAGEFQDDDLSEIPF